MWQNTATESLKLYRKSCLSATHLLVAHISFIAYSLFLSSSPSQTAHSATSEHTSISDTTVQLQASPAWLSKQRYLLFALWPGCPHRAQKNRRTCPPPRVVFVSFILCRLLSNSDVAQAVTPAFVPCIATRMVTPLSLSTTQLVRHRDMDASMRSKH